MFWYMEYVVCRRERVSLGLKFPRNRTCGREAPMRVRIQVPCDLVRGVGVASLQGGQRGSQVRKAPSYHALLIGPKSPRPRKRPA